MTKEISAFCDDARFADSPTPNETTTGAKKEQMMKYDKALRTAVIVALPLGLVSRSDVRAFHDSKDRGRPQSVTGTYKYVLNSVEAKVANITASNQ
jgi:hypothetical protein